MLSFKWSKCSLGSPSRWSGATVSLTNGEGVSVWVRFLPASAQLLHQNLGLGRGGLGDRGVEEGTDLTWKMTRRATTSTLFIGFPAGDKVRKLLPGRHSSLFLKTVAETEMLVDLSSQAPGTAFAETECRNQSVPGGLCPAVASLPSPPLPPPLGGPRKEQAGSPGSHKA